MKMNSKIEELDGEFRLMGQKINSFLEQSLKTNHEKKRLKLWSDKLLLENKNDETTKMNRNHYARYMVDFICKKGTIPGLCHKEPPEGNLPPLGQLLKCPQKSPENDSDCTSRMMEDQAENLFLEDKLNAIRHEVAMESDELEKILDENDCLLKSVNDLQKRIDHLGDIMNSLISDLEECSGGDEY
ncbi:uncharacterized protein LOC124159565 isoform X5 [Ischnura elegans]|uniref:uncharacterized protein LOC124159565 isoform X5 n=1 Tax=Ischnura elegans TaxID=197161 RepID=UPI001ED86683|nr:uncharacterized protein LOC124159565 isoform X5 [Ischnura elegans]